MDPVLKVFVGKDLETFIQCKTEDDMPFAFFKDMFVQVATEVLFTKKAFVNLSN